MQSISHLLHKRIDCLSVLSDLHHTPGYFLNSFKIIPDQIVASLTEKECSQRAVEFLSLGESLSPLLSSPNGSSFILSLHQLIHEYEFYFFYNYTGLKVIQTTSPPSVFPKPALAKNGSTVVLQYLSPQMMSFHLDYLTVTMSLLEVLKKTYEKILSGLSDISTEAFPSLKKLDVIVQDKIITRISNDLSLISSKVFDSQMANVSLLLFEDRN
ncbi:hypothetical protein GEMRC1_004129 [Eukaryota sp. GEM-RC1]